MFRRIVRENSREGAREKGKVEGYLERDNQAVEVKIIPPSDFLYTWGVRVWLYY